MVYAIADSRRRVVQVTCAGHPGPLLLPKSKPPRYLELPGSPIALVEGGSWAVESFPLGPGDRLALVSDGLLEATDARGQMVGVGRLLRMFRRYQGVEPQRACDAVIAEVEEWCRPAGFQDDCSLVMLEAVEEESVAVL